MLFIVLIVDDDAAVRFFNTLIVRESNIPGEPLTCKSGEDALHYLDYHTNENNIYLIFLDINMPLMSGWDFVEAIDKKSYRNKILIVMVTSSIDKKDQIKASSYKLIIGFIEKPITLEDCQKILNNPAIAKHL